MHLIGARTLVAGRFPGERVDRHLAVNAARDRGRGVVLCSSSAPPPRHRHSLFTTWLVVGVHYNELQKEVKAIRALLELEERARLAAALRDLLNVVNVKNPDLRHTMLFNSKNVLAPTSPKYKELLASADTIELAMAYEEYFCLTSLTHTRCLAELGMLEMARRDLEEAKVTSSICGVVMSYIGNVTTKEKDREKETVIPSFQKLVARNNVLEGYVTQYELLEAHNLTPAEFESKVALLAPTATVDGYVILMPAEREMVK